MISIDTFSPSFAGALHVQILHREGVPTLPPAAERRWRELTAANPRLFDGPILSVVSADAGTGAIIAQRDRYARLALAAEFDLAVRQLSVTAMVIAHDRGAQERVFVARRAGDTRVYPGLWEFGPSGGVDPPPPERTRLTADELAAALAREADEEAGIDLRPGAADVELVALLTDDHARSVDLVARCRLRKPIDHRRAGVCAAASEAAGRWEYVDAAWLTGEELAAFARDHAEAIAPPTRVMIEDAGLLKR